MRTAGSVRWYQQMGDPDGDALDIEAFYTVRPFVVVVEERAVESATRWIHLAPVVLGEER